VQEGKTPGALFQGDTEVNALTQAIVSRIVHQFTALSAS
jgi:hypothetical protein